MAEGHAPPAVPTKLVVPSDPVAPGVPISGTVQVVAGAGLTGRLDQAGKRVLLDATRTDAAEVFSLFVPGLVAAKTIGVWGNTRVSQRATAVALEANLLTAPTAGDASNYYSVRLADALGSSMVLPISSAGVSHYVLNKGYGVAIAQGTTGSIVQANASNSEECGARGVKIRPTQQLTITGIASTLAVMDYSSAFYAQPVTCSLLDAAGNLITSATVVTSATGGARLNFAFPLSVTLAAGTDYWVTFDELTSRAGQYHRLAFADRGSPTTLTGQPCQSGSSFDLRDANTGGAGTTTPAAQGITLQQLCTFAAVPAGNWSTSNSTQALGQLSIPGDGALLGLGGAAAFVGDVTASVVSNGAPAAGAAGSDLNVRALFLP